MVRTSKRLVAVSAAAKEAVVSAVASGGGGFGGGGGGGVFNIPAGKDGKISVRTVCLEHGTPNPRPQIDYRVAPLEEVTSDPQIGEMCRMLANDEIAQPVAQAAAWHVTDGLSWQEMLVKNRVEKMGGYFERFFSPNDLLFAQQVVTVSAQRAEQRAEYESQQSDSDNGDYAVGQLVGSTCGLQACKAVSVFSYRKLPPCEPKLNVRRR